jgi:iron complex transport system substrate-binding protein
MTQLLKRRECASEAVKIVFMQRQAEAQQIIGPLETPAPDMLRSERRMHLLCIGVLHEPEQSGSPKNRETHNCQHGVEFTRPVLDRAARGTCPFLVAQRGEADVQSWSGARPRTESQRDVLCDVPMCDSKSQPQPRETVKLPKRAQNHDGQINAQSDRTDFGFHVRKGFIYDQPSATMLQQRSGVCQCRVAGHASVGIIGIHDNCVADSFGKVIETRDCDHLMTSNAPSQLVFMIGWSYNRYRSPARKLRQPLDQRLGAWSRDDLGVGGYRVRFPGSRNQSSFGSARRQALPYRVRQISRDRPRPGTNAGRQVEPHLRRPAIARNCLGQISAMFHQRFMPLSRPKRERLQRALGAIMMIVSYFDLHAAARAADLPRIASINVCTDQLLMTLADPPQILGLSPYSRDPARSWAAATASQFPRLSGAAEDVLILKPDVVVAGRFTKLATRALLKDQGVRVIEFDAARTMDDVKKQIRLMGDVTQHPDRASLEIGRLDAAIAHVRQVAARRPYRVLAVSRRGWVSGGDSLTGSLLANAGLSNAASDLGLKSGGFASLEAIVSLKPDFILVSEDSGFAEDEGSAFLLHPALERFYPASKRIVIPERLTVCGGPMLSEAIDRLASELERVDH